MENMDEAKQTGLEQSFGSVPDFAEKVPEPADENSEPEQKEPFQSVLLSYLHDITWILAVLLVVFPLLFRVVQVYGTSMNRTLYDGDYLLLLSSTLYREPKHGDIIVASKKSFDDGTPIIKRVIATEHQIVDIDFEEGIVYVDGVALEEPYTLEPTNLSEGVTFPLEVKEGCIFVMGDNRNASKDSRSPQIGQIDKREVVGKVLLLLIPGTNKEGSIIGKQPFDIHRIGVIGN